MTLRFRSVAFGVALCLCQYHIATADSVKESLGAGQYEIGGSNFTHYDIGAYAGEPTDENWFAPNVLKHAIAHYHLHPELVRQRLQAMCEGGQRKIALFLWYGPFGDTVGTDGVFGHLVDSSLGELRPQHAQNLRDLVKDIADTRHVGESCFNELVFRFATQGTAYPPHWTVWNEGIYQQNLSFVFRTREIVEQTRPATLRATYDLDAELGGITVGQAPAYARRLWSDYISLVGSGDDTYGFSIAAHPGRITALYQLLSSTGVVPQEYALDIYGNFYQQLTGAAAELASLGQGDKSIIVQETYYLDLEVQRDLFRAIDERRLPVRTAFQWQIHRDQHFRPDGNPRHFGVSATPHYPYAPTPRIDSYGLGCEDQRCIWIIGSNFTSDCRVSLFDPQWVNGATPIAVLRLGSAPLSCSDDVITFRLPDEIQDLGAVNFNVSTPYFNWSSPRYVSW